MPETERGVPSRCKPSSPGCPRERAVSNVREVECLYPIACVSTQTRIRGSTATLASDRNARCASETTEIT